MESANIFNNSITPASPWLEGSDSLPHGYSITAKGVEFKKQKDGEEEKELICGPLWAAARTSGTDGKNHGLLIKWQDRDKQLHEKTIRQSRLHEQSTSLAQELADEGLFISPGKETHMKTYLARLSPNVLLQSVDRLGWSKSRANQPVFARPDVTVTGRDDQERILFQPTTYCPTALAMSNKGDVETYKTQVVARIADQPILLFHLLAAFAAPLMKHSGTETGGFHIYGKSTGGKTTALQVAASVWGDGSDPQLEPDNALCQTWRATSNGLEGIADAHNDSVLCLDEIGKFEGDNFGALIYLLLGGVGKFRMTAEAALKKVNKWRLLLLSSGEISILDRIKQDGHRVHGGQLVRIVDVPVSGSAILNLSTKEAAELADTLKSACSATCFGVAGPAFLQNLLAKVGGDENKLAAELRETVEGTTAAILSELPDDLPQTARRIVKRFALVLAAGYLAQDLLELPLTYKQITDAVMHVIRLWTGDGEAMKSEDDRAFERFQSFLQSNLNRFAEGNKIGNVSSLSGGQIGYTVEVQGKNYLCLTQEGFTEACGQFTPKSMVSVLVCRNLLERNDGNDKAKVTIGGQRPRLYKIDRNILEIED